LLRLLAGYAPLLLCLGLAFWLENTVTLHWSLPYCSSQEDGPAYAALGLPLPFERYSGASSHEFFFMPHVYLLNVVLLAAALFPVVRWLLTQASVGVAALNVVGLAGAVLLLLSLGMTAWALQSGALRPAGSLGAEQYGGYTEYRPVGLGAVGAIECPASPFWFPHGWLH
jgi:hypothetical protein